MKIYRVGIMLTAVLLCALGAGAAAVSQEQAALAAKAWAAKGSRFGARFGRSVEKTATVRTAEGHTFHAVKFSGGGTVFTSADTDSEPIVAFTSSTADFSSMDTNSPLYKLLSRDALVRANIRALRSRPQAIAVAPSRGSGAATTAAASTDPAAYAARSAARAARSLRWTKLLSAASAKTTASADRITDQMQIDDLRIAPLLATKWSQRTADGTASGPKCYDYYTPVIEIGGVGYSTPCGCTATATAQMMRYLEYPTKAFRSVEYLCEVGGVSAYLKTIGGAFEWDKMVNDPRVEGNEEAYEAIGRLTYDVGVSIMSSYDPTGTGAYPFDIPDMLDRYGYSSSRCFWYYNEPASESMGSEDGTVSSENGLHNPGLRRNVIYTNLDCRRPVVLAIYGYDAAHAGDEDYWQGHSVVGDGYGIANFTDETTGEVTNSVEYVHINMGWGGSDDAWYNIPEIAATETGANGESDGSLYTVMASAVYNVFTNMTGEIVSGRILDVDGNPMEGAFVSCGAYSSVSDAAGIYSLIVPSNSDCEIEACSSDKRYIGNTSVTVGSSSTSVNGSDSTAVGNRWGIDVVLELSEYADSVRRPKTGELYVDIASAAEVAGDGETLEILKPTLVSEAMTLEKNLTITATNSVAAESPVYVKEGVKVAVDGGRLSLTNVVFAGEPYIVYTNLTGGVLDFTGFTNMTFFSRMEPLEIAADAEISVAGNVVVPQLRLGGEDSFVLAGAIENPISLLPPSLERGARIGTVQCSEESAYASSKFLVHPNDSYVAAMPSPYPVLRWMLAQVEDKDLVATLKLEGDDELYRYSDFDRLLVDVTSNAEIVVKRDCSFNTKMVLENQDVSISCDPSVSYVTMRDLGGDAGFVIGDGASLSVNSVNFRNYTGNGLFMVDGAGAELEFVKNVIVSDVAGTNAWSGAVSIFNGEVTVRGTCAFRDCEAAGGGMSSGNGGAFYLAGEGCALNLFADDAPINIIDCFASGFGGGIFAGRKSEINVSGVVRVMLCASEGASGGNDNLYLDSNSSTSAVLRVVGKLYDDVGGFGSAAIGLRYYMKSGRFGNGAGQSLAVNGCAGDVAEKNAESFFSDIDSGKKAVLADDSATYVWTEVAEETAPTTPSPGDLVRLIRAGGQTTNYYKSVSSAFADLDGGETMELLDYCHIDDFLTLTGDLKIRSDPSVGEQLYLMRLGQGCGIKVAAGASLVLENVYVIGMDIGYIDWSTLGWIEIEASCELVEVDGGSLTLGRGATVGYATGSAYGGDRSSGGITVWNGGSITMLDGSKVEECWNEFVDTVTASAVGGGILLDNAFGDFRGGEVVGCKAYRAAGIFAGNGSVVRVSGTFSVTNNFSLFGDPSDLVVEKSASLVLAGGLAGKVGVGYGINTDTNVFGSVDGAFPDEGVSAADSAAAFVSNENGAYGVVATNSVSGVTNLVWSTAFGEDEVYVDGSGVAYGAVWGVERPSAEEDEEFAVPSPIAFTYVGPGDDGMWTLRFTNAVQWCWYSVFSTNSLQGGFVTDGVEAATNFQWKAEEDEVEIKLPGSGGAQFWKATGSSGRIEKD